MFARLKQWRENGVSLRVTFFLTCVVSVAITIALLYSTYLAFRTFRQLSLAAENYIELQSDASSLLEASDYLTEQCQRYATIGAREHLDNYFLEAEVQKRRETAIKDMESRLPDTTAFENLAQAMQDSAILQEREYYAMRLVLSAENDTNIPEAMKDVELSAQDAALEAEEKMDLAARMSHDEEYYTQKNHIRENLSGCIEELKELTHETENRMEQNMKRDLTLIAVLVITQSVSVLFLLWLTTQLGINPVLQAVEHIRNDQKIPIIGAREFRYLAGTYNRMYIAYKNSIENLSFKASHDELTGVYNRAGFDLIEKSVEQKSSAFLLFDLDLFKEINDTYGHEIGDRVLQKAASCLRANFRVDDYICRIGGDEFVVIMVHVAKNIRELIERKVEILNLMMADTSDGLPSTSFSVGVSLHDQNQNAEDMFHQADIALYNVKKHGRNGVCFYEEGMKSVGESAAEDR